MKIQLFYITLLSNLRSGIPMQNYYSAEKLPYLQSKKGVSTLTIIIWFWYISLFRQYQVKAGGLISNKYEIKMFRYVAQTIYGSKRARRFTMYVLVQHIYDFQLRHILGGNIDFSLYATHFIYNIYTYIYTCAVHRLGSCVLRAYMMPSIRATHKPPLCVC